MRSTAPPSGAVPASPESAAAPAATETFVFHDRAPASAPAPVSLWPGGTGGAAPDVVHAHEPAPPSVSAPSPDVHAIARKVYDSVAAQLRTELTLDRERAGLLTDLR
jgi:hypothetical protein